MVTPPKGARRRPCGRWSMRRGWRRGRTRVGRVVKRARETSVAARSAEVAYWTRPGLGRLVCGTVTAGGRQRPNLRHCGVVRRRGVPRDSTPLRRIYQGSSVTVRTPSSSLMTSLKASLMRHRLLSVILDVERFDESIKAANDLHSQVLAL